jgi:hypothetical protein
VSQALMLSRSSSRALAREEQKRCAPEIGPATHADHWPMVGVRTLVL